MFSGLSAFPLTPMNERGLDEAAFVRLIGRLVTANVDSIGVLGSTGNYAYLTMAERARVVRLAVEHAGNVPVVVGIGALRTRVVAAAAELLGLVEHPCLPLPLKALGGEGRRRLGELIS
jgi:4-hydroxy-tetrahydrodipicolinate synthase